jgi:glucosamine--fructose-6-phosphate aminotransferase (isomerizing)
MRESRLPSLTSSKHILLQEIREQPRAILDTIELESQEIRRVSSHLRGRRIRFLGMGSSYYASVYAKYLLQDLAQADVEAWTASEFVHYPSAVSSKDVVVTVSQSGESIETVRAVQLLKKARIRVLGITNQPESTLAKLSDTLLLTHAGKEKASATKTFVAALALLNQLAVSTALKVGQISESKAAELARRLLICAREMEDELPSLEERVKPWGQSLAKSSAAMILGRGFDFAGAMQGALLIKEVAKIPTEAMTGGEFMHGPIEIVTQDLLVVALSSGRSTTLMRQLGRRIGKIGGRFMILSPYKGINTVTFREKNEILTIFPSTVLLELLTYFSALEIGLDPDHFRFISKVTTAE